MLNLVSIGDACGPARKVLEYRKSFNHSEATGFFDSLMTTFETVLQVLQCDPESALVTTKVKRTGSHDGYARMIFTDFEKLESIHDIKTETDSDLVFLVERYRRRWHRLMEKVQLLHTVVFVFGGTVTEKQVYEFFDVLKMFNQQSQAYLMCVHDGPSMNVSHPKFIEKLRPDYRILHVSPTWDQQEFDWPKMFEEVQATV
jgi:hypothetical protein